MWNNVVYELQTYVDPDINMTLLKTEIDPHVKLTPTQFPWFLNVKGEITDDKQFSTYEIASHYGRTSKTLSWKENQVLREAYQKAKEDFEQGRRKTRKE